MVTSIKIGHDSDYRDLFNMASDSLKTFIKDHVTSAKIDDTKIISVTDGIIDFNKTALETSSKKEITSVEYTDGTYIYEDMGETKEITLTNSIVTDICQAFIDIGGDTVAGLEEYFGIIKTLTDCLNTNYQILPLDEEAFEIDANKREIKIPKNNYIYAVKGDNLAETIFFTIDRYFDNVDLATKDIVVLSSINGKKYWTAITLKDLISIHGKIKFGWPIGNIITDENSGTLEFSVRFIDWKGSADNPDIAYSFSTLPTKLVIKDTLNFLEGASDVIVDNSSDKLKDLLTNNDIHGTAAILAPEFYYPTQLEYNLGGTEFKEPISLGAAAFSLDNLDISYAWTKDSGDGNGYQSIEGSENDSLNQSEYIRLSAPPTATDVKVFSQFFYKEDDFQDYKDIDLKLDSFGNIINMPEGGDAFFWYRKGSVLETANTAGHYQCIAKISRGLRTKTAKSNIITIPYPSDFTIKRGSSFSKDLKFHFKNGENHTNPKIIEAFDKILINNYEDSNRKGVIESQLEDNGNNVYSLIRTNTKNNVTTEEVKFGGIEIYPPLSDDYLTFTVDKIDDNTRRISWKKKSMPDYVSFKIDIIDHSGVVRTFTSEGSYDKAYIKTSYPITIQYTSTLPYLTDLTSGPITTDEKTLQAEAENVS